MRVGVIGDIHGSDLWKEQTFAMNDCEKIIFLGDYVDDWWPTTNDQIINNLLDIIQFKKDNMDKVVLLYGNHCNQYRMLGDHRVLCSGYRPEIAHDLYDIFRENKDLFQNAYQINDCIFTHAGIQHNWFVNVFKGDEMQVDYSIAEQLNAPLDKNQDDALFQVGYMRGGRMSNVGGIFWCDRDELKKPLEGFTQFVGHTQVKEPQKYVHHNSTVYFCDCQRFDKKSIIMEI